MTDPNARRNFATLVAAAYSDGLLTEVERQVLHRKATELDIPVRLMNEMLALGEQGKLAVTLPQTREAREALLDDLLAIVTADGRVEAPEHHVLTKFASHLGISAPELRTRIRDRMDREATGRQQPRPKPPPEARRAPAPEPAPDPVARHESPLVPSQGRGPDPSRELLHADAPPPIASNPRAPSGPEFKPLPPGPIQLDGPRQIGAGIAGIPPVTLELLKTAIQFEPEPEAVRYIERMLSVPAAEAKRIFGEICRAFGIRAGSQQLGHPPRR
jgi:uncharacterized tellurite resistance protein B-like protein